VKRVLVTCVGSGIGQSVVDSLKHLKDEYFLIGSDRSRYCYSIPDCDDFVELPRIDDPQYIDVLLEACADLKIDAAIPGHDQELALFARNRRRFEAAGTRPVVAGERLVALLRDKRAWSAEFGRRTRRVVAAYTTAEFRQGAADGAIAWPAIAKPVGGSASAGLRILRRAEDLEGLGEDYVIQPFLFPTDADPETESIRAAVAAGRVVQASEISVQLVYSRDCRLLGRFASRNRLKAGVPIEFMPVDSPDVWSAVDEICEVLAGYEPSGPINLQGRMTDEGLVFFEMNPRFTGITGNRAQLGFNEVSLLVDNFTEGSRRPLRVNPRKVGVRQVACRAWPQHRFHFGSVAQSPAASAAIVVLGGTSWLARHFVEHRAARGDALIVVCRDLSMDLARDLYAALPGVEVLGHGSAAVKDGLAWADVVINCISGRPPQGNGNILDAHVHQMRLLDLAESCDVPRIVNVSSQSVYDDRAAGARDESAPLDASAPYAFSKYVIEECVRGMARRRPSVSTVSLRLARLFGAASGLRPEEFPHRVVACAVGDREIEVQKPSTVMDLLDLRDAVRAIGFFVDRADSRQRGDVYNVGSGKPVTVADYVTLADRICRDRFDRPLRASLRDSAAGPRAGLDCGKLAQAGWLPEYPLERSVTDLFEYFSHAH
jgi:nucleoside-diphosphate-sugar epimerase